MRPMGINVFIFLGVQISYDVFCHDAVFEYKQVNALLVNEGEANQL